MSVCQHRGSHDAKRGSQVYAYDTYMCVCEYIYVYSETLGSADTSMRP
jgi:hypothetical protein